MAKRLIAMQCGERSLGHLALVFGLLAVGTLSLSVATDFWLFTTEALDLKKLTEASAAAASATAAAAAAAAAAGPAGAAAVPAVDEDSSAPPPTGDEEFVVEPAASEDVAEYDYYDQLNTTDDDVIGDDYNMNYLMPDIVMANLHSGLWRSCIYYDFDGISSCSTKTVSFRAVGSSRGCRRVGRLFFVQLQRTACQALT